MFYMQEQNTLLIDVFAQGKILSFIKDNYSVYLNFHMHIDLLQVKTNIRPEIS